MSDKLKSYYEKNKEKRQAYFKDRYANRWERTGKLSRTVSMDGSTLSDALKLVSIRALTARGYSLSTMIETLLRAEIELNRPIIETIELANREGFIYE